jgi:hypothetical protein
VGGGEAGEVQVELVEVLGYLGTHTHMYVCMHVSFCQPSVCLTPPPIWPWGHPLTTHGRMARLLGQIIASIMQITLGPAPTDEGKARHFIEEADRALSLHPRPLLGV